MADELEARKGREGNRWINERPSGEDVATWFEENVPLHEGLEAKNYVAGVTLIPNKEKSKTVIGYQSGIPQIREIENLIFTPYAKVETRVKYFHDLLAKNPEWFGVIEPVEVEGGKSKGMPPGFFTMTVAQKDGSEARFVCCSMRVRVYKAESVEEEEVRLGAGRPRDGRQEAVSFRRKGDLIIDAPPGTKMVPLLNRGGWADENALMKAETGAVGRALGLAGMLVIPGTGVASAEDLQEAGIGDQPAPAAPPESAQVPAQTPEEQKETLVQEAGVLIAKLRKDHPDEYGLFAEWVNERGLGGQLADLDPIQLRGLTQKAQKHLTKAEEAAETEVAAEPEAEAPPPQGGSGDGAEAGAAD